MIISRLYIYLMNNDNKLNNNINFQKVNHINSAKKISIVMAYCNNKREQTIRTLKRLEQLYSGKYNFEVVIVDEELDNIISEIDIDIKLIKINKDNGCKVNDCNEFNRGFEEVTGEIIIIQNPECYHVNDILEYSLNLNEDEYYSYSCFSANSFEVTSQLLESKNVLELIKNKKFYDNNTKLLKMRWYNHPILNKTGYHFCSAIHKSKLELIKGFDSMYVECNCFDDDLLLTIKYVLKLDIKFIDPKNGLVIHQYYKGKESVDIESKDDNDTIKKKWLSNKLLFENKKEEYEKNNFRYPRLLHLYWDTSPLSFLNYLTVVSFNQFHKYWKIIIYIPKKRQNKILCKDEEQKVKYTGKCYFDELRKISNVVIREISLNEIGFDDNACEDIKKDYLKYYILHKHGGVWSDFDILYTDSIEGKMNFPENTILFYKIYYPIGFF